MLAPVVPGGILQPFADGIKLVIIFFLLADSLGVGYFYFAILLFWWRDVIFLAVAFMRYWLPLMAVGCIFLHLFFLPWLSCLTLLVALPVLYLPIEEFPSCHCHQPILTH